MIITQEQLFELNINNYKFHCEHTTFLLIKEITLIITLISESSKLNPKWKCLLFCFDSCNP